MLTEFDQNTIANMTAALEFVCNRIPSDRDVQGVRKEIADAIMESANAGGRSVVDFQNAGLKALESSNSNWFSRLFR
jgi:hypothetical protein